VVLLGQKGSGVSRTTGVNTVGPPFCST